MNAVGRPRSSVNREELEYFVNMNFTRREMANIFEVSERTIGNYLREFGMRTEDRWHDIHDDDLDDILSELTRRNPTWGERMIAGALDSMGLRIRRQALRGSMHRIDQEGIERRRRRGLHRREYRVAGPNALWHIDGNHKLIRWRFVIHGGIDGFSRLPVFLDCHTDNKASSMMASFRRAVDEFGVPQRVRADRGGENVGVCEFMLQARGLGRGSFITGRSVHNQRIERLWRDVFQGCLVKYYHLFYDMEQRNMLRPVDDLDLFCLHYVFLPLINKSLQCFRHAYVHHRIRTAVNRTPLQLWVSGVIEGVQIDFLEEDAIQAYGVERYHGIQHDDEVEDRVIVPATRIPFPPDEIELFHDTFPVDVNALNMPSEQIEYYLATRSYLQERWHALA